MKTKMIVMLIFVGILFGAIFTVKAIEAKVMKKKRAIQHSQLATVSTMKAKYSVWGVTLKSTGSLRTVQGVKVTPELAGMVRHIYFTPGSVVQKGDLLAQLDIDPDVAELHRLEAQAKFAKITYVRNKKQFRVGAISKETLAQDESNYKSTAAAVVQQKAIIAKKTIRAPFAGKLGVSNIYVGQYLNPGDSVSVLETIKPIYDDFYLPQGDLYQLKIGQTVDLKVDTYPKEKFQGKVTTINPEVNVGTRNIEVEATLQNEDMKLLPGMFNDVTLNVGKTNRYLTFPQTTITFSPFGDYVYVLEKTTKKRKGKTEYRAVTKVVVTGPQRGDQVAVVSGIKEGDEVVTAGQLKLQNGSMVLINNTIKPADNPDPNLVNKL